MENNNLQDEFLKLGNLEIIKSESINPINSNLELLEKGMLNTSKLIKKKVEIHSNGKVYQGFRWVSVDSNEPLPSKKESKDVTEFKAKHAKAIEKIKEPKQKEEVDNKEYSKKISDVVSDNKEKYSNKIRNLIGLGVTDPKLVVALVPEATPSKLIAYIKEAGIDPKAFNDQLVNGINEALGNTTKDDSGISGKKQKVPNSEKDDTYDGQPISELQKVFDDKKVQQIMDARKKKRQAIEGDNYKKKFDKYKFLLDQMIDDRNVRSAIIYGTGGVGKSFTALDSEQGKLAQYGKVGYDADLGLESGEYDYVKVGGNISAIGMYKLMYKNKDKLIVFDDCDNMWDDPQMANMLKTALDTTGDRVVTWEKQIVGNEGTPNSFKFTGQCLFISNLSREKLGKYAKPLLESRCISLDMSLSMDQTLDMLDEIKDKMKIKDNDGNELTVSQSDRADIVKMLRELKNELPIERVNGRTLYNLAILRQSLLKRGIKDWNTFKDEAETRLDLK